MTRAFVTFASRPHARAKIFCLPHAGGFASTYRSWARQLDSAIELWSAALPGRGTRAAEAPVVRLDELINDFEPALRMHADRPYALFGHSMGGLLAFELAARLANGAGRKPAHLFISAAIPPHFPHVPMQLHQLPDAQLVRRLRELGGIPPALADDREAMTAILPALRADLELVETYQGVDSTPPRCHVTVLGGLADPLVGRSALAAWKNCVQSGFSMRMYPGGHFYLHSQSKALLSLMERALLTNL
jgi:medium-chain acyl-[acyl-carrier-protein] hydrolase